MSLRNNFQALSRPKTASIRNIKANSLSSQNRLSERDFGKDLLLNASKKERPSTAFQGSKDGLKSIIKLNPLESAQAKIKMWLRSKSLLAEDVNLEII